MGKYDYADIGNYNVICDRCGQKYKATDCKLEWNNLFVCYDCFEPRHPQDFVQGIPDHRNVPIARPDSEPTFVEDN
jgi:hypothetical protein